MKEGIQTDIVYKNPTAKGIALEKEFCTYLKRKQKYSTARRKVTVGQKSTKEGAEIDIIAGRLSKNGKIYFRNFLLLFGAFLAFTSYSCYLLVVNKSIVPVIIYGITSIFVFMVMMWVFYRGIKKRMEHAWVECKHWEGQVTNDEVGKVMLQYREYLESYDKDYNIVEIYFVAKSGFSRRAMEMAKSNNFICFVKNSKGHLEHYDI